VRIFATDVDIDAIAFARRGVYPASALVDLPPHVLERYFNEMDGAYEIKKLVRGMSVFGQHDLGQRAPFPRIDLTLCRNVLIYFTAELQRRALQLFAISLREGGYLVLGKSETTSPLAEFFVLEHPRLKVYRRRGEQALIPATRIKDSTPLIPMRVGTRQHIPTIVELPRVRQEGERARQQRERSENLLLRLPVGVVIVDRRYDIQSINNAARRLLGIHGAAVGEDFIHLVQGVVTAELRASIDAAFRQGEQVRGPLLEISLPPGERRFVHIMCYPEQREDTLDHWETVIVLVLDGTLDVERHLELEQRLRNQQAEHAGVAEKLRLLTEANQRLLGANEELTTDNAELRSANKELLAANEESQAATEEVETLNEELQATNDELETLNEELQATVEELNTTNDDQQSRSIELQDLAMTLEDQRRASDAERGRLQAVLGSMADAVVLVDRNGTPIVTNEAFDRTFLPSVVLLDGHGHPLQEEATPQQRAARGETFRTRFSIDDLNGERRWFEASGEAIHGPDNEQGGVIVIREATEP
jgi:two-component system CheB/CheR fusion protein